MKFHAIFVIVLLLFFGLFELGTCKHEMIQTFGRKMMRAAKEIPTDVPEIQRFAISAVEQYNIEQVLINFVSDISLSYSLFYI